MAKNTRKLSIVVSVRDQTKKALKGIRAQVRRFSEATSKALARAFKIGLASMTAALAGFTLAIKQQFSEIDQLAKDAFRFGIAIENIRGLELAGKLAGLSLSEMTTILRDTARRVSEAAQGTGEATDAITELGLDAKALNMMPVEHQLDIIIDRLGEVENTNDRVRLAYDIMGRSGTKGLSLIGTSIQGAIRETEMLGSALNDEIAANVQQANDDLLRMKEAFKGIVQTVVADLAPVLTKLFKQTKKFFIEVRHGIKAIPLAVEAELLKIRKMLSDFEADILGTKVGKFLFGEQAERDLRLLSREDEMRIKEIAQLLDGMAAMGPGLKEPSELMPGVLGEEGATAGTRAPAPMPGLTSGRLLTGAAQSSAERLWALQKEADNKRAKEAADAKRQRDKQIEQSRLLGDLMRSALQGTTNMGTLLQ